MSSSKHIALYEEIIGKFAHCVVSSAAPPSPEEVSYCKIRQKCIARIHFLDSSASTGFGSAGEQTLRLLLVTKGGNQNRIFEYAPKTGGKYGLF